MNINIYNEDCLITMDKRIKRHSINVILTSPPYNTMRSKAFYDVYKDDKSEEEYIEWTINIFDAFERILGQDGVVLYNLNYGAEKNVCLMWNLISDLIRYTDFMVADQIIWKKTSAYPSCMNNKLTRICENVFVFCRKSEYGTFQCNKKYYAETKRYESILNFVEARNNDGVCDLNKTAFSSELVCKLLRIYAKKNNRIYDPFMGTGTTGVGCRKMSYMDLDFIGSEISEQQIKYAMERLNSKRLF